MLAYFLNTAFTKVNILSKVQTFRYDSDLLLNNKFYYLSTQNRVENLEIST